MVSCSKEILTLGLHQYTYLVNFSSPQDGQFFIVDRIKEVIKVGNYQ